MYNFECPVNFGQNVWKLDFSCSLGRYELVPCVVDRIAFVSGDDGYRWCLFDYDYRICTQEEWMKTAFPTKEEAETALKNVVWRERYNDKS